MSTYLRTTGTLFTLNILFFFPEYSQQPIYLDSGELIFY